MFEKHLRSLIKSNQKENDCFFQKNNGNHFFESELRMKKDGIGFFMKNKKLTEKKTFAY